MKPIDQLMNLVIANHTREELALGYMRYQIIRKFSPRHFGELHELNMSGRLFDELIDGELAKLEFAPRDH